LLPAFQPAALPANGEEEGKLKEALGKLEVKEGARK
jgi:hypothetical protein